LADRGCDLAVIVRGGGSKADLASFDSEAVARAIAMMPIPVWVGIGHTGDQSVADIVANRSFVTPTECGQELVGRVESWWASVSARAIVISRRTNEVLDLAARNDDLTRRRLARCALQQLGRHSDHLTRRAELVARLAPRQVEVQAAHLSSRADRISSLSRLAVDRQAERVDASRRLLAAYDVERQLERGYTLTLDSEGRLVRSVANIQTGDILSIRFADGTALSSVEQVNQQVHEQKNPERAQISTEEDGANLREGI
jgi:exodeoxyribonuclease VII large subunit